MKIRIFLSILFFFITEVIFAQNNLPIRKEYLVKPGMTITKKTGLFMIDSSCNKFVLNISDMGGFIILRTINEKPLIVDDITAIAILEKSKLLYSVSPIYGKPGIFLFDFKLNNNKRIVKPSFFKDGFSDGTDYFEIYKLDLDRKEIYFWELLSIVV